MKNTKKALLEDKKKIEFTTDYNNFGIIATYDRDDIYKVRNEITIQIAFWTLFIRFNFSFWKPKKVVFKDPEGNREVMIFKRDFFWTGYCLFIGVSVVIALCIRYMWI